jgi:hypothetical protein
MNKYEDNSKALMWFAALVLTGFVAGCGSGGGGGGGDEASAVDPNWTVSPGAGTGAGGAGRGPASVVLGGAGNYAILTQSLISTTATAGTAITGDIGISPAAASFIQGFSLTLDGTGCFSTPTPASLVTGKVFAADYNTGTCTTPTILGTAIADKDLAFTDANGRAADHVDLGTGNIGGMTLPPAVYKWATGVLIPTDLVLSGGPNDVWIFQIAQGITVSNAAKVTLTGGALPKNIFWATGGVADFGTTSHFEGIVLSASSITMNTGASTNGRMLAKTEVTLDSNAVTQPAL